MKYNVDAMGRIILSIQNKNKIPIVGKIMTTGVQNYITVKSEPVSYTHLDVYKRQG